MHCLVLRKHAVVLMLINFEICAFCMLIYSLICFCDAVVNNKAWYNLLHLTGKTNFVANKLKIWNAGILKRS